MASMPLTLRSEEQAEVPLMRDVFAAMPDSVLPLVTKNNRLDCIDFIENNMEAKVRNAFDEYVTLEALTSSYARFRTSAASLMELKLLPVNDTTSILCIVTTAQMGEPDTSRRLEDSNIRFLRSDWSPLSSPLTLDQPSVASFFTVAAPDSLSADARQAYHSLLSFHPLRMQLSEDCTTLTLTLQTAYLSVAEKKAVYGLLQPLVLEWNGEKFR